MAKSCKYQFTLTGGGLNAKVPTKPSTPAIMSIKPQQKQFEPTVSAPMRQHYNMAGGG